MRTSVSRNFRQFVLNKYPKLEGNAPFLRFFHYLCFADFFDEETHRLVIPVRTIAESFYQKPYTSHFNGKAVLEEFRNEVLPGLVWTGHMAHTPNSWKGKAREVISTGFDAEMLDALHEECLRPSDDQVDFVTGQSYARRDRYDETAEATARYEAELQKVPLNPTQIKILDHLRGINAGHLFLRKLHDNADKVKDAIGVLSPEVQEIRYRIVACVHQNPNVYYLPSVKERTCRLSPRGDCILGLKSTVRKALCSGWVECDLRSSQFAILASTLQAPLSQAFIESGESIWRSFYLHTHGLDEDPPRAIKKVFKETMYSLCFGKSTSNLIWMLKSHRMNKLLSHPILQELLTLRGEWFDRIRQGGGAVDVWGHWQALDLNIDPITKKTRRWEGAVAASVIQSVEMEIIAPIFDVAAKYGESDQFKITLFQHDGACISFNSTEKTARAQRKLRTAVETRARELGVSTVLEFTAL